MIKILNEPEVDRVAMGADAGSAISPPRPGALSDRLLCAQPSLARFLGEIAAIVAAPAREVRPDSRLVADLGFDALAFGQLGALLFELYGVRDAAISPSLGGEEMTVRKVFDSQIPAARRSKR